MAIIQDLKAKGLTGVAVAMSFVYRRVQPLKQRIHPSYEYAGDDDTTREVPDCLPARGGAERFRGFFKTRIPLTNRGCPKASGLVNPRPEDQAWYVSKAPLPETPIEHATEEAGVIGDGGVKDDYVDEDVSSSGDRRPGKEPVVEKPKQKRKKPSGPILAQGGLN